MLYKFKSDAGGDVIMLESAGRQILEIVGKGDEAKGILLVDQMPDALVALQTAIKLDESSDAPEDESESDKSSQRVSLRTRSWPLMSLIESSLKAQVPVTWGV